MNWWEIRKKSEIMHCLLPFNAVILCNFAARMKIELAGTYSYGRMMRSSLPAIFMMLFTSVYSVVDGLFVSNYAGTTPFAALNLIFPALMVIGAIGLLFGTGGSALVAMIMGQGDLPRANRAFGMIIKAMLITGLVLSVVAFIFLKPIAILLGAEGEMIQHCVLYGRIILCVMPLYMTQMAFQSFYMTAEVPALGTRLTIICGVTNIVLDALFIVVFGWGLLGAAIATAIGMGIGGLYPLYFFGLSKRNRTKLKLINCRPEFKVISKVCTNGLSEYVGNISLSIVSMCYNLQLMRLLGENGVAVYGILLYIGFAYASVFIGFNITMLPVISYNYGAKDSEHLKILLRRSIILLFVAGSILTIMSELLSDSMAGIFVGHDLELKAITSRAIRIYMISFAICGINMFVSAWFTALNNGLVSAVSAIARTLVFELGAVFVLPRFLGLDGVWLAVDVADTLALILSAILLASLRRTWCRL